MLIGLGVTNLINHLDYPVMYWHLFVRLVLSFGLLYAFRWAFILMMIIGAIHVIFFAAMGGFVLAVANLAFTLLIVTAKRYYYPEHTEAEVI